MFVEAENGLIVTAQQMIAANPLTCPTAPMVPYDGYAMLAEIPAPAYDPATQRVERAEYAVLHAGQWQPQYSVIALTEDEIDAERKARIPQQCTPAQGLVALFALKGITDADLLTAIGNIQDEVQRYTAMTGFQRATEWRRDSPTMQAMAQLLGLTEADLDALYTYATGVQV